MRKNESPISAIIGCLVVMLCVGILYLWSVFKNPIMDTFGISKSAATMIASYMLFSFTFGSLIGGFFNDKKGPRFSAVVGVVMFSAGIFVTGLLTARTIGLMNLTYAVVGGLGSGFAYGGCLSCIQKWMPHKRGLASGLAVSAFGLSTVIFAPFSKFLMSRFPGTADGTVNFMAVFFTLAIIFFILGIISCMFIRLPSEAYIASLNLPAAQTTRVKSYTPGQAARTLPFWCLIISMFFINGTWNMTVPQIYDLGLDRGLTVTLATFCLSFTGLANAAGRLLSAWASDIIGRVWAMVILSAITLIGALLMIFVGGWPFIVVVALLAFAYGGPSATQAAMSTDFFGPKYSGTNYGIIMLALGFSSIFFNVVSQKLLRGEAAPTFIMAACTAIVPIIMMLIIRRCQKTWNREQDAPPEQ